MTGPTALRELTRRGLLDPLLASAGPAAATAIGTFAGLFPPVAYNVVGAYRDYQNGTFNRNSLIARGFNLALVGGTFAAAAATGALPASAAALVATQTVYTPIRDFIQYNFPLNDNNVSANAGSTGMFASTFASAGAYAINQTLIGYGMDALATALTPSVGALTANIASRSFLNTIGEIGDELFSRTATNLASGGGSLEINLHRRSDADHTNSAILDQALDTHAGRSALNSAAFLAGYAYPGDGWGAAAVVGGVLGSGYPAFVYTHDKSKRVSDLNSIEESADAHRQMGAIIWNTSLETVNEVDVSESSGRLSRSEARLDTTSQQDNANATVASSGISLSPDNAPVDGTRRYDDQIYAASDFSDRASNASTSFFSVSSQLSDNGVTAAQTPTYSGNDMIQDTVNDRSISQESSRWQSTSQALNSMGTQSSDFINIERPAKRTYSSPEFEPAIKRNRAFSTMSI